MPTMTKPTPQALRMSFAIALPPLHRAYRAAADKAVAHVGLSQALAWPVVFLGRLGGDVRPGVLAEALGIEAPSLARSLDQLVDSGLAERREDPNDRRAKILNLTPAGHAARDQIEAALHEMRDRVFDGVSEKDLATCLRVFAQLGKRVDCTLPVVPGLQEGDDAASSTQA
jgi:MarR family transcriptional regulator for hemolysin